jgi:hypothetical protein
MARFQKDAAWSWSMPVSVANSSAGGGLSNLLRQTRPVKAGDEAGSTTTEPAAGVTLRQLGRGTIDSTGSTTAPIKAALTLYLSTLGTSPEATADRPQARSVPPSSAVAPRSGASDVLQVLDSYATDVLRLSA